MPTTLVDIRKGDTVLTRGFIEYNSYQTKSVEVDGELYTKSQMIEKTAPYSMVKSRIGIHCDFEYSIECCNFSIKYKGYPNSSYVLSSNDYVKCFQHLYLTKQLPAWIVNVDTYKGYDVDLWYYVYERALMPILICNYGFNNRLYAFVKLNYALQNPKGLPYDIKRYFLKAGIDVEKTTQDKILLNLFIKQIHYATCKQQIPRTSFV